MDKALGDRIKEIRKKNKLTQKELADRLFVTASYISQVEKNKETPTEMFLKLFAYELNVSFQYVKTGFSDDGFSIDTREGCLAKYRLDLKVLNRVIEETQDTDIQNVIQAFSYFVSLISGSGYTKENKSLYYKAFYNVMDELEKIQFHSKTMLYTSENSLKAKNEALLYYLDEFQEKMKRIDTHIKEMINVFLQQYGFDYRLK